MEAHDTPTPDTPTKFVTLAFFAFLIFSSAFGSWVGAPWVDLDGHYYQHMAETFGGHVFRSNWYPVGLAALIRMFWTLGLSVFWVAVLGNTLRLWLQMLLLRKFFNFRTSLFLTFFTQGLSWLILGVMLKAESFFVSAVLASALCLMSPRAGWRTWGPGGFLALALLFRHAGLFLAPALFVALWQRESFQWKKISRPLVSVMGALATANFINSGHLLHPSRESFVCMHFISAANSFDYCSQGLARDLCALDPGYRNLNANNMSMDHLNALEFQEDLAPQLYLKSQGMAQVCQSVREIYSHYFWRAPLRFIREIFYRLNGQLGAWESTELSLYEPRKSNDRTLSLKATLQQLLNKTVQARFLWKWALVGASLAFLYLCYRRFVPAAATFLFWAGWGHAAGIALNNPFRVMRYQEVTFLFLASSLVIALFRADTRALGRRWWNSREEKTYVAI